MNNKKIAYIVAVTDPKLLNLPSSGIKKKIDWQIKALFNSGLFVDLKKEDVLAKRIRVLPFHSSTINWKTLTKDLMVKYNGLYHRHVFTDSEMLSCFKKLKELNPDFKIILEFPTYPYDIERKKNLNFLRDFIYRKYLHKYVDRVVVYDNYNYVFNIPTIKTHNGIDFESVEIKNQEQRNSGIDICMIADFEYWHGVDRWLKGLLNYYKNEGQDDIRLHLVGGVSSLQKMKEYKAMADNPLIREKVLFYGNLVGKELDHIYDICHMASASLGRHRTGINVTSEIKTREYMAKGIPFIYSTPIDVFMDKDIDFALQISIDDKPVNIKSVVKFYYELIKKYGVENLSKHIRDYGLKTVSMDNVMKPVADYFLNK